MFSTDVEKAAAIIRGGGLVAFPTETVYGLGANALDVRAVARVFEVKGRPHFDPLIVHVADVSQAESLVTEFPPLARQLAAKFWPGPLTLVLPKQEFVPDLVTAGCPTVAVRIPDHPLALALLRAANVPIAAPSANLFGRISPTTAEHVREQLGDAIDLILDGGPCRVGVESTVLQLTDDHAQILRPGGITLEELSTFSPLGKRGPGGAHGDVFPHSSADIPPQTIGKSNALSVIPPGPPLQKGGEISPGMLPQHYAPRTPLVIYFVDEVHHEERCEVQRLLDIPGGRCPPYKLGLLRLSPVNDVTGFECVEILSPTGDLREAAANFFAALRRLDAAGLDAIVAHPFPDHGLGRALNDRLSRASHFPASS